MVLVQLNIDDRRNSGEEIIAAIVFASLMAFGALCGGISGPIIAVMTMRNELHDKVEDATPSE
ncbi:MAG: hypothetical protein F4Y63_09905 [Chloroflexi bacterium]|nr:hypothetical protein [Chloroflexota bacterium]MYF79573.1 hypothetical protein [Chloroflexota bacterium]MYK62132.1 hypothetical protein [Chloroflexota bacterium]